MPHVSEHDTGGRLRQIESLESVLVADELSGRVEMVLRPLGADTYRAAAVDGAVEFERRDVGGRPAYEVTCTQGRNPLAVDDPDRLIGHRTERARA